MVCVFISDAGWQECLIRVLISAECEAWFDFGGWGAMRARSAERMAITPDARGPPLARSARCGMR